VGQHNGLVHAPQAERLYGQLLVLLLADRALGQGDLQACHGYLPAAARRRSRSARGSLRLSRPSIVACTTFMILELPRDLARMSLARAFSRRARTPPPAIMPVPGAAGLSMTSAALNFVVIACGIVVLRMGTRTRFLRAM